MHGHRTAPVTGANKGIGAVTAPHTMLPLLRRAKPAARVVRVSSELGSLAHHGDSRRAHPWFNAVAYPASKAALNEGARASVRLALLDDDGPTGGFFDARCGAVVIDREPLLTPEREPIP